MYISPCNSPNITPPNSQKFGRGKIVASCFRSLGPNHQSPGRDVTPYHFYRDVKIGVQVGPHDGSSLLPFAFRPQVCISYPGPTKVRRWGGLWVGPWLEPRSYNPYLSSHQKYKIREQEIVKLGFQNFLLDWEGGPVESCSPACRLITP